MARGSKQIVGQLSFDMCLAPNNYVCQSNDLIKGKQTLKLLNSIKLIRITIMQVVWEDKELKPYTITINELSKLLGVPSSNLYRDIDNITNDIINHPVEIRLETKKNISWMKIPWVSFCQYDSDVGLQIKLNDELKPYLLNLKDYYTQYELEEIIHMNSIYSIKIYELLREKIKVRIIPQCGIKVYMSITEIRECCDCLDKHDKLSHLKSRVIDKAFLEINEKTLFSVSYEFVKKGKAVVGLDININMRYHQIAKTTKGVQK